MSYRVEISPTNRAVCVATECKKAGTKIEKGELRLGTWVPFEDRGSYKWRHWGCVTGNVLQNLRNNLEDSEEEDGYNWGALDGLLDDDKNSLIHAPDLQEKVRRCIKQGFIDREDFNGDPEMNKLGEKGLHTKETMKRKRDEAKAAAQEGNGESAAEDEEPAEKKSILKKRKSAKNGDIEDEDEDTKPAKKRVLKAKKEEQDENGEDVKPKKSRAKKVKEEGEDNVPNEEEQSVPPKKSRAKKVKKEEEAEGDNVPDEEQQLAQAKKSRAKKVKKEADDEDGAGEAALPKKRAPRDKKVKKEEANGEDVQLSKIKPAAKKGRKKVKNEEEAIEDLSVKQASPVASDTEMADAELEGGNDENVEVKPKKARKSKKVAKPRGSRNRSASKVEAEAAA